MPELPEVETIVRALRSGGRGGQALPGRTVASADLLWERTLAEPLPAEFSARLRGQTIQAVGRRAKFILIQFDPDTLLIHLRMSGDLRVNPALNVQGQVLPFEKHDRLALQFEDGLRMVFNDPRKFGRAWLLRNPQDVLSGLGPEPLEPAFSAQVLYERLHAVHRQVKPLLLDQSFVAGLGNIYTDESLHMAGIHPLTPSDQLAAVDADRLWLAIRAVLEEGIRRNGASFDWVYRGGEFQNNFRAYGRTGEACPVCGTPIQRITVGQRGTHFCPKCQPLRG